MVLPEASTLAKFGFSNKEIISTRKSFSQQLESYALHVIEDKPVSNSYSYFIDRGEIFIDSNKTTKLNIDLEERGGLATLGTKKAIGLALSNPGQLVFFYSPPGPVAFETETKYDKLKPYPDGQLYLLVGNTNNRVDAIAISVGKEQEKQTLQTFLGEQYHHQGFDDEVEKIKYFLTNPAVSKWNLDNFLSYIEGVSYINDFLVYRNVHEEEFKLSNVLEYLINGWSRKIRPMIDINHDQYFNIATTTDVKNAYLLQIRNYFVIYAQNGKMPLGGGCGGSMVSENDLDLSDPLEGIKQINPLSTEHRLLSTSLKDIVKKNKEDRYEDYKCPECGKTHHGELKGSDRSTWLKSCDCGHKFNC